MRPIQLLQLLKIELSETSDGSPEGCSKSAAGALELIELFKKEIEDECFETYKRIFANKKKAKAAKEEYSRINGNP